MNFYNTVVNQISETKDFPVNASSLKEVRTFSRDVFEKINLPQDQKDELVLAIAEAAQNIVKHGYKGVEKTAASIICFIKKVPKPPGFISSNCLC